MRKLANIVMLVLLTAFSSAVLAETRTVTLAVSGMT
jgi:hypothetical protein